MFKKINVAIYNGEQIIYRSNGKTVLSVMITIISLLKIYGTIKLEITIN